MSVRYLKLTVGVLCRNWNELKNDLEAVSNDFQEIRHGTADDVSHFTVLSCAKKLYPFSEFYDSCLSTTQLRHNIDRRMSVQMRRQCSGLVMQHVGRWSAAASGVYGRL